MQTFLNPNLKVRVGLNFVCEDNGKRAKIALSEALFVPDYGKNIISLSNEFGDNNQIVTIDGTVFPLMQENNLY